MINPNNVFTKEQWNSLSDGIQKEIICGKDYVNSAIIGSIEIVDCVQNHPSVWAEKEFIIGCLLTRYCLTNR